MKIKRLKQKLGNSENFEFKFNKCSQKLKIQFLNEIKGCKFRIRSIIFDKKAIYSKFLRNNKEKFYNFPLREVLEHHNDTIKDAKIRFDGSGEKIFKQQLTVYLRKCLNSQTRKVIKNLRFRDSKSDVLIQMADMIAGSIRRFYDKNTADWDIYRKIIRRKEEDVWEFK